MIKEIIFKKIRFKNYHKNDINKLFNKNGLFVFPSGPGLSSINNNKIYLESLRKSDHVFFDSGYFVLLLRFLKNISVKKFSGYLFFKYLIKNLQKNKFKNLLCIHPSDVLSQCNNDFFIKKKIKKDKIINYTAPYYNISKLSDNKFLKLIDRYKPDYIIINIGGGVQEILGYYLKKKFKNNIKIFCTGAAISFFTGDQAPINKFLDNYYMGWLLRIFYNPRIFLLRYFKAFKLFSIVISTKVIIKK